MIIDRDEKEMSKKGKLEKMVKIYGWEKDKGHSKMDVG
jgi:hypothetical protein